MLSKRRAIVLNGQEVERTPLLVPSFSSKGFPNVHKIIEYCSEIIDGPALFSAYDLHHGKIQAPFNFPSLIFLDSGGYEASKDAELSDFGEREHVPQAWTLEMHQAQLAAWKPIVPSVAISFDRPDERLPISEQIARARGSLPTGMNLIREILLKPETAGQTLLQMPAILGHIEQLATFDIVGVTEKEIGNSVLGRMQNIAALRKALTATGADTPVHVFGSLDTVSTPLYFLAGADIFDGLTWLRFAFHEGQTVYKQNYGALKLGVATKAHIVDGRCWNSNYYYMKDLELEMRRFLNGHDFSVFKYHRDLFRDSLNSVLEAGGG
jgi:hypothetical protein